MKKINICLTIILTLFLFFLISCILEGVIKAKDTKQIEKWLKEYMIVEANSSILEATHKATIDIMVNDLEYNSYLNKVKENLSHYVSSEILQKTYIDYKKMLDEQRQGKYRVIEYTKELVMVTSIGFDKEYIFLEVNTLVTFNKEQRKTDSKENVTNRYNGPFENEKGSLKITSNYIVKKEKNSYKIVECSTHNIGNVNSSSEILF